jgi:hypothetical protein
VSTNLLFRFEAGGERGQRYISYSSEADTNLWDDSELRAVTEPRFPDFGWHRKWEHRRHTLRHGSGISDRGRGTTCGAPAGSRTSTRLT